MMSEISLCLEDWRYSSLSASHVFFDHTAYRSHSRQLHCLLLYVQYSSVLHTLAHFPPKSRLTDQQSTSQKKSLDTTDLMHSFLETTSFFLDILDYHSLWHLCAGTTNGFDTHFSPSLLFLES